MAEVKTLEQTCPNCGGMLRFQPKTQSLVCDYCSSSIAVDAENKEASTFDYFKYVSADDSSLTLSNINHVIKCQSCGGSTQLAAGEISSACSFCGSIHVIAVSNLSGIKPQYIIPFSFEQEKAAATYNKWRKKLFLAPACFKKASGDIAKHAVYIPIWSYFSDTQSQYKARRGDVHYVTKTRRVNGKTQTYQERVVIWTNVSGRYDYYFARLKILASHKNNRDCIERINNYNEQMLINFDEKYLAGFAAEMYSVNLETGFNQAKNIISRQLRSLITNHIGGDYVERLRFDTNYFDIRFRLYLAPLYIYQYQHKKKFYPFAINGQTGKSYGKHPLSPLKVFLLLIPIIGWIILVIINLSEK